MLARKCSHCGSYQRRLLNVIADAAPVVSLIIILTAVAQVILAFAQVLDTRKNITNTAAALSLAKEARKATEYTEERILIHESALTNLTTQLQRSAALAELSDTILRAENDDRHAFERLLSRINDKADPLMQPAANAYSRILGRYASGLMPPPNTIAWLPEVDPTKLPLSQFRKEYKNASPVFRADIVQRVSQLTDTPRHDKMAFFAEILKDDQSLDATYYAGKQFVALANDIKLTWSPFNVTPLLQWWDTNKASMVD